jgi:hypothetical protein
VKIDRLLIDIWDWIRRVLWWEKGKIDTPAYQVLETYTGRFGVLRRVTRDTPRAVDTWICSPFQTKAEKEAGRPKIEILILLDHLEAIQVTKPVAKPGSKPRRTPSRNRLTHRIQVIATTHLQKGDWFEGEVVFQGSWDLQGNQPRRDFYALQIMQRLFVVLIRRKIDRVDWAKEIEITGKEVMGAQWTLSNPTPPKKNSVTGIILDKHPDF